MPDRRWVDDGSRYGSYVDLDDFRSPAPACPQFLEDYVSAYTASVDAIFPYVTERLWFIESYGRRFAVMARTSDGALGYFRDAKVPRVSFAQGGAAVIVGGPDTASYVPCMDIGWERRRY